MAVEIVYPLTTMSQTKLIHKIEELVVERDELQKLLRAASHCLRSYQYGNVSPDAAKAVADKIEGGGMNGNMPIEENLDERKPWWAELDKQLQQDFHDYAVSGGIGRRR